MRRAIVPISRVYSAALRLSRGHKRNITSLSLSPHFILETEAGSFETKAEQQSSTRKAARRVANSKGHLSTAYFTSHDFEYAHRETLPGDVVQRFRLAIEEQDIPALHTSYHALRQQKLLLQQDSYTSSHTLAQNISSITADELRSAMQLAVGPPISFVPSSSRAKEERDQIRLQARSKRDGGLVQLIFKDLREVFGFTVTSSDCSLSISGMILQKVTPREAFRHLQYLCSSFDFRYQSSNISSLMGLCRKNDDVSVAQELWTLAKNAGIDIEYLLRDLYLHILLRAGKVEEAEDIAFHGSEDTRIYADKNALSYAWFLESASRAGLANKHQLESIARDLLELVNVPGFSSTLFHWHALAVYYGLLEGASRAMQLILGATQDGQIQADAKTFNILLLCHEEELDRIASMGSEEDVMRLFDTIQNNIRVEPNRFSYSIGIATLLGKRPNILYSSAIEARSKITKFSLQSKQIEDRLGLVAAISEDDFTHKTINEDKDQSYLSIPRNTPGQINEAKILYHRFRSRDQLPDKAIAELLIKAYTKSYLPFLTDAISVYDDLRLYLKKERQRAIQSDSENVGRDVYDMLLNACANARDSNTASRLIQDMFQEGVAISPSNAADFTILALHSSTTYEAAFQGYQSIRDAALAMNQKMIEGTDTVKSKAPFDQSGMLHIISCFSKLKLEDQSSPPVHLLLDMVSDMKRFKFSLDANLFTTLLRFYGYQSSANSRDRKDLQYNVIEMHAYIQRENVEPDLTLVTALMDAYNRVGLTQQALEIWHRLILNNTVLDCVCIAVALDTCGFGGKLNEVRRVWKWVRSRPNMKRECNKAVWDAYVEALARCGQLQEAIEVAFGEMRNELISRQENECVDAKTMEMLLRFSSSKRHWWIFNMDEEYPLLSMIQQRLQRELPEIWDQVKNIHIPRQI